MRKVILTRHDFLQDRQGRTFADVLNDPEQPFDAVLKFFNDEDRQRRMEESEIHHDRAPLAGDVRELEAQPAIDEFLSSKHPRRTKRLRQAVGVVVRMIMERLGWKKTGKKGSLGVRAKIAPRTETPGAYHNTGGLAFWFLRAERYERKDETPFLSVKERAQKQKSPVAEHSPATRRGKAPDDEHLLCVDSSLVQRLPGASRRHYECHVASHPLASPSFSRAASRFDDDEKASTPGRWVAVRWRLGGRRKTQLSGCGV